MTGTPLCLYRARLHAGDRVDAVVARFRRERGGPEGDA